VSVKETLGMGTFGMVLSIGAAGVSTLTTVEQGLRIVSLLVGIAVGVATFVTVIQKKRENKAPAQPPAASSK
jgi:tellurite resistance protein TehA-like permease